MKKSSLPLLAVIAALTVAPFDARATKVYALTETGSLLTFDHATPGTISNNVAVTGLGGYELLAIDVRPTEQATPGNPGAGTLWGIGKSGTSFQLFVLDPATGAASAIGSPIAAGISGAPGNDEWGFDFNPGVDRIRLVNSSGTDNYRLNPNNGQLAFTDVDLAYAAGDANFGAAPQVDAGAYTTVPFGAASTFYCIDTNLDTLVTSANPNTGQLQTVGALGVNIDQPNGFDIFRSLALFSVPGVGGSTLCSVDLSTGAATVIGNFPALTNVRGLAISISDAVDQKPVLTLIGRTSRTTRSDRMDIRFRATDDSGIVAGAFRAVRQSPSYRAIPANGSLFIAHVRRLRPGMINPVLLRATDPAGHTTQVRVLIRRVATP